MNYEKLGLIAGLEIHQQLEGNKLFCNCPTLIREDKPNFEIKRYLRASAGETGEIDIAAKHENKKEKYFVYQGYHDTNCLVELDEEPPHDINKNALNVAIQCSLILKANISEFIQVMRKTVIDGSNTSGFQRTSLVARDGKMQIGNKIIGIDTICIEEDSCKIINKGENSTNYNLDRLGIPLVEIATKPDIRTPEEAKISAEKLGMILRSTNKVKRGLGTIRQDVNVSIKEGARVEIKGAQDLKTIPLLVENEVKRQANLIEIKKKVKKINDLKISNLTKTFENTNCKFIKKAISNNENIIGFKLNNFSGLLGIELMPNHRLGTELAGYAKVFGFGGIIHSDEKLKKYEFTEKEISEINKKLDVEEKDAFILIIGNENRINEMVQLSLQPRIKGLLKGIPKEVRKANVDGTSTYMRPMPGAARMYPETDVKIEKINIKEIKLPELIENKIKRFEKIMGKDLAILTAKSEKVSVFEKFVAKFKNVKPAFIAETMLSTPREIKRKFNIEINKLTDIYFEEIFNALNNDKITKDSIQEILLDICKDKFISIENYKSMSDSDLEKEIKLIVNENKDIPFNALIGKVMSKLKGKADGKKIVEILKKLS